MPVIMLDVVVDVLCEHRERQIRLRCDRGHPDDLVRTGPLRGRRLHLGFVQRGFGILDLQLFATILESATLAMTV